MLALIKKAVRKFIKLDDTFSSYVGLALQYLRVNAGETGLETTVLDAATKALSNLASVAINASLLFDTDNAYDVGSAIKNLKNIYSKIVTTPAVAFPATQVPSADANTLDDYEEGTWTPALKFSGNSVGMTYSTQTGVYVKIGRTVFFMLSIGLTAKGSSTGSATVSLPFTPVVEGPGKFFPITAITFTPEMSPDVTVNYAYLALYDNNLGSYRNITDTAFADNSYFIITGFFFV